MMMVMMQQMNIMDGGWMLIMNYVDVVTFYDELMMVMMT